MLRELERNKKLQTHFKIKTILTEQQFYEYFSRFNAELFNNITKNIFNRINKSNRKAIKEYLIDATPVAVDINTIKKNTSLRNILSKLKHQMWAFQKLINYYYIGFKVTVVLDKRYIMSCKHSNS